MTTTICTYEKPTVWIFFNMAITDENTVVMTPELSKVTEDWKSEDHQIGIEGLKTESTQKYISVLHERFHQLPCPTSPPLLEGFECYTPEKADAKLNSIMCYEIRLMDILCDFLEVFIKASPILRHSEETALVSRIEGMSLHRKQINEESLGFFFQFVVPNYNDDGRLMFTSDHLPALKEILLSKNDNMAAFAKHLINKLETIVYSQKLGILTHNCVDLLREFHNYISKDAKLLQMSKSFNSILKINRILGDYFMDALKHPDDEFFSKPELIDQLIPILDLWIKQQVKRQAFYEKFKTTVLRKNKTLYKTWFQDFVINLHKQNADGVPKVKSTNYKTYQSDCLTLCGRIRQILPQEDASWLDVSCAKKTQSRRKAGHKPKHKKDGSHLVSESTLSSPVASSSAAGSSSSSSDYFKSTLRATEISSSSFASFSSDASSSSSLNEFTPRAIPFAARQIREIAVPYPFSYRVLDMLSDSPRALQEEAYVHLSEKERRRQHLLHGFSLVVDSYIHTHALKTVWNNQTTGHQDVVHFIPGQVKWEGERMSGVFNFTVGKDGRVYHRFFSRRPVQELMNLTLSSFKNIDFPSLKQADQLDRQTDLFSPSVETTALYGETVRQHRIYSSIHIKDPRHKATLILYPKIPIATL